MSETPEEYAARDLRVCPPTHLLAFRKVCRALLAEGLKPTPKLLGDLLPSLTTKERYSRGYTLPSGKYSAARRQELRAAGWSFTYGRWRAPMVITCDVCGDVLTLPWPGSFRDHNEENYERHVRLSTDTESDARRIIEESQKAVL